MTPSAPPIAGRAPSGSRRGWCPGVFDPMQSGDGWLLRIRLPGGAVQSNGLRTVAAVADQFGSGAIDITSRANLQIRGVEQAQLQRAAELLADAGLAVGDAQVDARRAVVASPLAGHDVAAIVDASAVVDDIVRALVEHTSGALPSKFGVVVDDGGSWPLEGVDADVRVTAAGSRWLVTVRGIDVPIGAAERPEVAVVRAARLCIEHGARMDDVVAGIGLTAVETTLGVTPAESRRRAGVSTTRPIGTFAHHDPARCNVVALPFLGRLHADRLTVLARLADDHHAAIRLTADHSIAFCGIRRTRSDALLSALIELGLLVDATDPRSNASACVGAAGCLSATVDTTYLAERIVRSAPTARFHLSACPKGCGAPANVRHLIADQQGGIA